MLWEMHLTIRVLLRHCRVAATGSSLRFRPRQMVRRRCHHRRTGKLVPASELPIDMGRYPHQEPVAATLPSVADRPRNYLRLLGMAAASIAVLATALLIAWWRMPHRSARWWNPLCNLPTTASRRTGTWLAMDREFISTKGRTRAARSRRSPSRWTDSTG